MGHRMASATFFLHQHIHKKLRIESFLTLSDFEYTYFYKKLRISDSAENSLKLSYFECSEFLTSFLKVLLQFHIH